MKFHNWEIDFPEQLTPFFDQEQRKMVFLLPLMDEVQAILCLENDNQLTIEPGWNIKVSFQGEHHIKLTFKTTPAEEFASSLQ